ncbi:hypothetical protein FPJ12_27885, partial [Klebsiella pneumoniae]|uniref:hypothetical protein n=1 Tax=Klebsiella pneumoniae TaxID=573 RepID=UPI0013D5EEBC
MSVELTVQLGNFGSPGAREETVLLYKRDFGAPVKAEIVDMTVFETPSSSAPLAALSEARKQRYAAQIAAVKAAEAEDRRLNQTFSQGLLAEQIAALRKGEDR